MNEEIRPVSQLQRDSTLAPNWLLCRADIPAVDRICVLLLLMYEQEHINPTLDELAAHLGHRHTRNTKLVLDRLRKAAIVETIPRPGFASVYLISNPDEPRQKGKNRMRGDPRITPHDTHQDARNGHTPDPRITPSEHVGGVLHSESCDSESEQPTTPPLTELAKWLFRRKVSAAREFAHLDYDTAIADFEERRRAGQSIGAIVKAWRAEPPTPEAAEAAQMSWIEREIRANPALYGRRINERGEIEEIPYDDSDLEEP